MSAILDLLKNGISEMKKTGRTIYAKKYIKTVFCNNNWDYPFSVSCIDFFADDKERVFIIYGDTGKIDITVENGWVTKIGEKINSVSFVGQNPANERSYYQLCFSN